MDSAEAVVVVFVVETVVEVVVLTFVVEVVVAVVTEDVTVVDEVVLVISEGEVKYSVVPVVSDETEEDDDCCAPVAAVGKTSDTETFSRKFSAASPQEHALAKARIIASEKTRRISLIRLDAT